MGEWVGRKESHAEENVFGLHVCDYDDKTKGMLVAMGSS